MFVLFHVLFACAGMLAFAVLMASWQQSARRILDLRAAMRQPGDCPSEQDADAAGHGQQPGVPLAPASPETSDPAPADLAWRRRLAFCNQWVHSARR